MSVDALSRVELLTLLSIMEGELEAQEAVIHSLRVSLKQHINAPTPSPIHAITHI